MHLLRARSGLDEEDVSNPAGGPPSEGDSEVCVVVVIRELEIIQFVAGTLDFASAIPEPMRQPWYRGFTKTLFFAGNPDSLESRFDFDHLSAGGSLGWIGPAKRRAQRDISRMLRLFEAPARPASPATTTFKVGAANGGRSTTLQVATARVAAQEYLVHVNHVICGAAIRGLLSPGDSVRLVHTDELAISSMGERERRTGELRIAPDAGHPESLRLYAALALDPDHEEDRDE